MSSNAANDFLMGSGAKSVSWKNAPVGHTVSGTIASEPTLSQQTDMKTKAPQFWDSPHNTQPKMQLVITLQTSQRDPADASDDGRRALYVKGQMRQAIADAVRAAGADGLSVGGTLTVRYIGDGDQQDKTLDPPKHYDAAYQAPANTALMAEPPAAPQQTQALQGNAQPFAPGGVLPPLQPQAAPSVAGQALQAAQAASPVAPTGVDPALAAALGNLSPELAAQLAAQLGGQAAI